jgi:hypothetical protein
MEPRAGFDPATNSLQGCRSTGLSHRGMSTGQVRIFSYQVSVIDFPFLEKMNKKETEVYRLFGLFFKFFW